MRPVLLAAVLVVFSVNTALAALYDPRLTWLTQRSEHFVIHYHDGEADLAMQALAIAERVHDDLSVVFDWVPRRPTEIVLVDNSDIANGFATPVPVNRIVLLATSPRGVDDYGRWLETLITHEYVHILHLDKAGGAPAALRRVFGRMLLLFPNAMQTRWGIEGLATYYETDEARGTGRGQSTAFDMMMRMEAADGFKPLGQINQDVVSWPQGTVPYLYGVEFYKFLVERYGERQVQQWVTEYGDNLLPFFMNTTARQVFGKNWATLYGEFQHHMAEYHGRRLDELAQAGAITAGEAVTRGGYVSGAPRLGDDGTLYYIAFDGQSRAQLMAWPPSQRQARRLAVVQSPSALDVHARAGILLSQLEVCRDTAVFNDLYRIDPKTGKTRRLTHCGRYRFAAWGPQGRRIAAVANERDRNRLVLLDRDGEHLQTLWQGAQGEFIVGLDWSPTGDQLVAALWHPERGWNLALFALASGHWQWLTQDDALQRDPRFSSDGSAVLFSADYGGVNNLYRLDLASRRVARLTHVLGGAFQPVETPDGGYYFVNYSADGFDIHLLSQALAENVQLPTSAPRYADPPPGVSQFSRPRRYSPVNGLLPRWWLPHVAVDDGDRFELGLITGGWDALQRHSYTLNIAYDIENDLALGAVDYVYNRWRPVLRLFASRRNDLFRDGADDVVLIRHSDLLLAELAYPWLRMAHRWSANVALSQDVERDAWRAPGVSSQRTFEDNIVGAGLAYDSTFRGPLGISRAQGRNVIALAEDSDLLESDFSGRVYVLDWREFRQLGGRHVVALRALAGWGEAGARRFQLGGVDSSTSIDIAPSASLALGLPFNRRDYSLRGYPEGLARLRGQRMALASGEWRFPLRLVERGVMAPPLGLRDLSGAFFYETGAAWDDGRDTGAFSQGAGVEVNALANVFYRLNFNARLGYAHGFDEGGENRVYFRLGASF